MHRHAYQGRKLSRERDQLQALLRGQITSLVLYEQTTTTLAKAKEVAPRFDRLVTTASKDTLAARRALAAELTTEGAVKKLLTELLPAFEGRSSGFTRIVKLPNRRGDNAEMAAISLVLPAGSTKSKTAAAKSETPAEAPEAGEQPAAKPTKPVAKKTAAKS